MISNRAVAVFVTRVNSENDSDNSVIVYQSYQLTNRIVAKQELEEGRQRAAVHLPVGAYSVRSTPSVAADRRINASLQKPFHRPSRDLWRHRMRPIELPKRHVVSRLFQEWNHLAAGILKW
jgi:hypothetical protein